MFTDGIERDAYEDDEGRQYVLDSGGEHIYGQGLLPADEPAVVEARSVAALGEALAARHPDPLGLHLLRAQR